MRIGLSIVWGAIVQNLYSLYEIGVFLVTYSPGGVPLGPMFFVFWMLLYLKYLAGDPV